MTRLTAQAYTVAWLCALPRSELVVAGAMLDDEHDPLSLATDDDNSYTYGSINGHNVVIACMPPGQPGKVSASKLVQPLSQSFPNLKIHLFVGIGGGVPRIPPPDNSDDDVHLGDVVIGWAERAGVPGVVQWDLLEDGNTEPLGILDKPDRRILNALGQLLAKRIRRKTRFPEHLKRLQSLAAFSHPGLEHDKLFKSTYHHVAGPNCSLCDGAELAERPPRVNQDLIFHQGTILSGDTVMNNPLRRNEISQIHHGALCFEMEAAGVMDEKRCLIIRGIADYADSHKDGLWENYAAGTAAAFAREFLFTIQPQAVKGMESAPPLDPTSIQLEEIEDQKACLRSLSFLEIDFRKNDVVDPIDKTCAWLLRHHIYSFWLRIRRGLLWLKGKPGAGKSTLLRYALKQQKARDNFIIASFFFHGRGAPIQKTVLGFFRSLLYQILPHIPESLSSCSALFKEKSDTRGKVEEKWEWQASELQRLFKEYIINALKTHSMQIFVDALDECGEEIARVLVDFFQELMDELPDTKTSLQICFSCRHYPFVALENGLEICVEEENQEDIEIYICNKLNSGIKDETMSKTLQADILSRSLNVFQWVVLVVPHVILLYKKGRSLESIRKALHTIPTALNDFYRGLLQGIDDSEKRQCLKLMQWICFAFRPLSLKELRFALAVDADTPHDSLSKCQAAEEFAVTNEELKKKINDLSKGLAEVKAHDDEEVAQFVHHSVADYLINGGLNILTQKTVLEDAIGLAHFQLSRSCIRYISMKEIVGSPLIKQKLWISAGLAFPFFKYAVTSWAPHAKAIENKHISQRDLLDFFNQLSKYGHKALTRMYEGQTLLHIASMYGLYDVVSAILDTDDAKPNSKDCHGRNPLLMAADNDDGALVKLLLAQKNIAPNLGDELERTPLYIAANRGHVEVVKLLLARKDVLPNLTDINGNTPLHIAASCMHAEIVKLLLVRNDLNPGSTNYSQSTPLHEAASRGHVKGVKLLLAQKTVSPNLTNNSNETPLHIAARFGHEKVVELLLARKDVSLNLTDHSKETPLHVAIRSGHNEIVKLLLARKDLNPNLTADFENTPLHIAARYGHTEIVKLLFARKDLNPNSTNRLKSTPLHGAASFRHVELAKFLLSKKDVSPNLTDDSIQTPLHIAASRGYAEIAKLLLARDDVLPSLKDSSKNTPLHIVARRGYVQIVELLLARKDVNPNSTDDVSRSTPLHKAVTGQHVEIVKLLLARKDVHPNLKNLLESTPLHEAATVGHVEIVRLLLTRKDIKPNSRNGFKSSPLQIAASSGHTGVVRLPLARDDVLPNLMDSSKNTPFHAVARRGYVEIVKLLLARKDVHPNLKNLLESTSLHEAATVGHVEIVRLLLTRKDIKPNSRNGFKSTPLQIAACSGHTEVVRLLLARDDVLPNLMDSSQNTPLHAVARRGYVEIVELLLAREDVNPNLIDKLKSTSLRNAASFGHVQIVKLLLARKDVNPNSTDDVSRSTPLHKAVTGKHVEIVKLLLARKDVHPNLKNILESTPLYEAATLGHVEIVRLLLRRKNINPNLKNGFGITPLQIAAISGHTEVVILLLARKDVIVPLENQLYPDPILVARKKGYVQVVKLLESARLRRQK